MKVDTFGGAVHVEWDPDAAVTPLGHLAFFAEYLKVSGRFDALVADSSVWGLSRLCNFAPYEVAQSTVGQ